MGYVIGAVLLWAVGAILLLMANGQVEDEFTQLDRETAEDAWERRRRGEPGRTLPHNTLARRPVTLHRRTLDAFQPDLDFLDFSASGFNVISPDVEPIGLHPFVTGEPSVSDPSSPASDSPSTSIGSDPSYDGGSSYDSGSSCDSGASFDG